MGKFDPKAWMAHMYLWKNRRTKHEGVIFIVIGKKYYRQHYSFGKPSHTLKLDAKY